jgi:hypothetical protein
VSITATRLSDRTRSASAAALAAVFAFRLWYGLSMPFWSEDERQVYLIGLRSFARGEWPSFGADVVWSGGQLPGALQAMLVRWPLAIWRAPEAPFVLLNLLSFAALLGFAWFLGRRFPDVPRWLIAGLVLTCPWTLNFSTHVINTSYVLPGAIVFFVGFFEAAPAFRRGIVPLGAACACMGFGLLWVMQIHMSWVVLPVYVLAAFAFHAPFFSTREEKRRPAWFVVTAFLAGAAVPLILLWPTLTRYGPVALGLTGNVAFQPQSPLGLITTAARVLSFSSFELLRFLGLTRADRVLAIWRHLWIAPFLLVVLIAGVAQPIWMVVTAFRKPTRGAGFSDDWRNLRLLVAGTVLLIYASYFLSIRGQQAHAFYLVFPISATFAVACWQVAAGAAPWGRRRLWERVAAGVFIANLVVHAGLAIDRWPRQSLYADRALVSAAIADRNDRYLGDRRDTMFANEDHRPRAVDRAGNPDAYLAASATDDLHVEQISWTPAGDYASGFAVTIAHRGALSAWVDLRYVSAYLDASGRTVETHEGVIKRIIQPGETRTFDVSDGNVPDEATVVRVSLTSAEHVIPVHRPR